MALRFNQVRRISRILNLKESDNPVTLLFFRHNHSASFLPSRVSFQKLKIGETPEVDYIVCRVSTCEVCRSIIVICELVKPGGAH